MQKNWLRILFFILLLTAIIWAGISYRQELELERFINTIASYGIWAPLVFIGFYIAATIFFLPGAVMTIAGGLLFGPLWGTLYNITGAIIGSTLAFLIARYLASDWVAKKTGGRLKQLMNGVETEGWRFVAVVRLIPIVPFNLLNYALGLTPVNLIAYVVASIVFMLPATFAYSYLGSLGQVAIEGKLGELIAKAFIAIGLLVLVGSLPWLVKRLRKNG